MPNPMTMKREEIIDALRAHTTKKQLDAMLWNTTAYLRGALAQALSPEADKYDMREQPVLPKPRPRGHLGIEIEIVRGFPIPPKSWEPRRTILQRILVSKRKRYVLPY